MPTLAAMAYKTSIGQPIIYPRNDLNYAENFLHMMFAGAGEGQKPWALGAACWALGAGFAGRLAWARAAALGGWLVLGAPQLPSTRGYRLHTHLPYPCPVPRRTAVPSERYEVDPELAKALEIIFILHLDHEQNASTSTVRRCARCAAVCGCWLGAGVGRTPGEEAALHLTSSPGLPPCTPSPPPTLPQVRTAGSSQANPFACVASGIAALWGPAHGGANEAVLKVGCSGSTGWWGAVE